MKERSLAKKQRRKARTEMRHLLMREPTEKEFIDYMEKRQKVEKELEHKLHKQPTEHEVFQIMAQNHKAKMMIGGSSIAEKT